MMRAMNRVLALTLFAAVAPAFAQTTQDDSTFPIRPVPVAPATQTQDDGLREAGRTAQTGAGEVGQRQNTRDGSSNLEVLGRIDNRIGNRVQNRLRNRIDRNYDPTANATFPFEMADDEARKAGSPR